MVPTSGIEIGEESPRSAAQVFLIDAYEVS
jgi:hypothetical protein